MNSLCMIWLAILVPRIYSGLRIALEKTVLYYFHLHTWKISFCQNRSGFPPSQRFLLKDVKWNWEDEIRFFRKEWVSHLHYNHCHPYKWIGCCWNANAIHSVADLLTESCRSLIHAENAVSHFISCNIFFPLLWKGAHQKGRSTKTTVFKKIVLFFLQRSFPEICNQYQEFSSFVYIATHDRILLLAFISLVVFGVLKIWRKLVRIIDKVLRPWNILSG